MHFILKIYSLDKTMMTSMNIRLMTYFTFVSIIGTLGNGVILLAYGNRWNSSKSTSVIFILILACVDLWTCLIVVPTIAIMEYRDFDAPTLICRFYSFSKNLIIISSFIMSFIALDRFLNIALPHYRLLNPRRVKVSNKVLHS
jgi:tellurite resistance protein TehA-like permease